ncbi:unnamed protein product [Blepharisma stoltei]|uniref:Uncharacterized protein n=1 Tax=Blepharisma stoltei TaxID=1481888 RepID=A0AAU9J0L6_9CILI|nr:unnamed protein product [Blepharisma stoltei]
MADKNGDLARAGTTWAKAYGMEVPINLHCWINRKSSTEKAYAKVEAISMSLGSMWRYLWEIVLLEVGHTQCIYCLCNNSLYQSPLSSKSWTFVRNIKERKWWSPSQALYYKENIYFVTNDIENEIITIWKLDCSQNTADSVADLTEL